MNFHWTNAEGNEDEYPIDEPSTIDESSSEIIDDNPDDFIYKEPEPESDEDDFEDDEDDEEA